MYVEDSLFIDNSGTGNQPFIVFQNGNNVSIRANFNFSEVSGDAQRLIPNTTFPLQNMSYSEAFLEEISNHWSGNFGNFTISTHTGRHSNGIGVNIVARGGTANLNVPGGAINNWSRTNPGIITMYSLFGSNFTQPYGIRSLESFQWTAAHEFGHALGVEHPEGTRHIMNSRYAPLHAEVISLVLKAWTTNSWQRELNMNEPTFFSEIKHQNSDY